MPEKKLFRIIAASLAEVKPERDVFPNIINELYNRIVGECSPRMELSKREIDTPSGFHPEGPKGLIDPILNIADYIRMIGISSKLFGAPISNSKVSVRTSPGSSAKSVLVNAVIAIQEGGRQQSVRSHIND